MEDCAVLFMPQLVLGLTKRWRCSHSALIFVVIETQMQADLCEEIKFSFFFLFHWNTDCVQRHPYECSHDPFLEWEEDSYSLWKERPGEDTP